MNKNRSIGVFDSGVGGLSVWRELYRYLPEEDFIYFADSQFCPYGIKSQDKIIDRCIKIVDFFISKNVKMIVVACNTATAVAIDYLRNHYSIPFVGMEPAIKPAAQLTQKGVVGVLATEVTFKGRLYHETSKKYAQNIQVETVVGKGFVELVESVDFNSEKAQTIVKNAVLPLIDKGIDYLVLACTHYPFLINIIEQYTRVNQIKIINPADSVAKHAQNILLENALLSDNKEINKNIFLTSLPNTRNLENLVKYIIENESYFIEPDFSYINLS